jgi:type IV pilus assembly protein PilB
MSQKLAEVLLRDRIITEAHYAQAQQAAQEGSTDHVRFLIEKGFVDETKLLYYLGQKFGLPSINLAKFNVPPEVIALVPMGIVAKAGAIPIQSSKGTLVLAVCDPTNLSALEDVKFQTKMNVEAVLTTFSAFEQAAQKYYGGSAFAGAAIESFQKESRKRQREQNRAAAVWVSSKFRFTTLIPRRPKTMPPSSHW